MKFQIAMKFKNGMVYTTEPMDAYSISGDGDMFRLMVKGKLDSKDIVINDETFNYRDLSSFEVIFND